VILLILKVYLDEDISPILAKLLRKEGIDALCAHDAKMIQKEDKDHLAFATQEKRVLISCNVRDFPEIASKQEHAGIILSRQLPLDAYAVLAEQIIDKLTLIDDWSNLVVWA